jgi:hypothetical protein
VLIAACRSCFGLASPIKRFATLVLCSVLPLLCCLSVCRFCSFAFVNKAACRSCAMQRIACVDISYSLVAKALATLFVQLTYLKNVCDYSSLPLCALVTMLLLSCCVAVCRSCVVYLCVAFVHLLS